MNLIILFVSLIAFILLGIPIGFLLVERALYISFPKMPHF